MPGLAVGVAVSRSGSYRSLMSDRQALTRSEELRSVTSRHWDAFRRGDGQAAISRYSLATGVTMFGTDVSEYIDDPDKLVRYRRKEFEVLGNWPLGEAEIDAWTEDNVGWSVIRSTVGFGEASRALRVTLVFRLEGDDWRVIHQHWSVGSPNPEVFGTPLTYSLEQVAEAVESRRPDLAGWAAADGTITVVFTDIESSTALNLSFGDQAWIEVLHAHNEVVERLTLAQGGTVVQRLGDGYMLVFPTARRALRAATTIESEITATFSDPGSPIRVRIGVHTGEVIRDADDFFGQAINYAARVAGAAAGGEVLASALVHGLVSSDREFSFGPHREVAMKGIEGGQPVYPLVIDRNPD